MYVPMPDGVRLWVERCGVGPPLLLVPGLGGGNWLWRELVPLLASRFHLVMPELRGSGRSDKPDERYSVARFAADLVAVLAALDVPACHVLGVSLGGFVAQCIAARWPDRVRRLVLAATSLGGDAQLGPPGDVLCRLIRPHGRNRRERLEDAYELGFSPAFRSARHDVLERITAWRLAHPQPEFAYYRQLLAGHGWEGDRTAHAIAAPTLVCAGEADPVVPFPDARALCTSIANAHLMMFPGRHLFFIEHAARFSHAVADFLAEQTP